MAIVKEAEMGALTVRNVDDVLIRRLKIRAAKRGVSAEEEHRAILRQTLAEDEPEESLVAFIQKSPMRGLDLEGVEERSVSAPVEL